MSPMLSRLGLCAAVAALALCGTARAAAPQSQPPALVAPLLTAAAPVLFVWTPVAAGGTGYRLHVQGRPISTVPPGAFIAVQYELQIGDRPDVGSHVLFDRILDSTTLLFDNRNVDGSGFTENQPPGLPLSGGTYYWRVRGLSAGPLTAFSAIGRFVLASGGATSSALHDLGVTSLAIGGRPVVGVTTPVVAHVGDLGSFPERDATLVFTANGLVIGRAVVPPLRPSESANVSVLWTPQRGGLAQIGARLETNDQVATDRTIAQTTFVSSPVPVVTSLTGLLVERDGGYGLADRAGRVVTALRRSGSARVDFASLLGMRVEVNGALSARGSDLVFAVTSIAPSRR